MIVKSHFGITLLLVSTIFVQINLVSPQTSPPEVNFFPEQNYVITLINYNEDVVDTNKIEATLPSAIFQFVNYQINYDIQLANSSYASQLNNYVDSISTPDWTSAINETALNEQKADFSRKDIFTEKNGTAIDARKLESYLADNLPTTSLEDDNLFYIFVFNNSRLDSTTQDHWLNATEVDPDSEVARFFWRLEWDYPENFDVKFPYPAFTETKELAILDPTAFQWYLTWRAIWNRDPQIHDSYYDDLDTLLANKTSAEQRAITTDTLINWLEDWIFNIFNIWNGPVELGTSFSLQLKVGYDSNEIAQENIEWVVNGNYTRDTTNQLLQSESFDVDIEFLDINSDPIMKQLIDRNKVSYFDMQDATPPFSNWTYIDGVSLYNDMFYDSTLNAAYFDPNAAEIVVKGIILLLDNASYVGESAFIPWAGGLFTGLGGNFQVTMLWELDRAFMEDHVTRKAGLSKVLVHEVGHAIGLPHTFSNRFTSDFASDVMGYYPGAANYSQIVMKIYQRDSTDLLYVDFQNRYENGRNDGSIENAVLNNAYASFENFKLLHKAKNYMKAYSALIEGLRILDENDDGSTPTSSSTPITSNPTTPVVSSSVDTTNKSDASFPPIFTWMMVAVVLRFPIKAIRKN